MQSKQEFLVCLHALAKIVLQVSYSDSSKTAKLKSPQGIFEWFVTCLLDQSVNPTILSQTVESLRGHDFLNFTKLQSLLVTDSAKLEHDLEEALKSYRFHNRAVKAFLVNLEKINKTYKGNLHNILSFAKEQFGSDKQKVSAEVWRRTNDFYWFGTKKSGVFIRELVNRGLWPLSVESIPIPPDSRVRRVLYRLGLVKDRNDLKEIERVARELADKARITPLDLDCVLWTVGDNRICGERKCLCEKCPLADYCPRVD